jgi:hypothetical protein
MIRTLVLLLAAAKTPAPAPAPVPAATEPPEIPFGFDAFTAWDRWPTLRIGVRAYMRATFDREGKNHNADAAHFLRQVPDGQGGLKNVALDEAGPGVLWFVRHNHWHGSPWTYTADGNPLVVEESSTKDPIHPVENSVFLPQEVFPTGLTWTWSITRGADLSWVPIPFERSLTLDYGRARYGTGYFILWKVMPGAHLSRPVATWDHSAPPRAVTDLLARSGTDIAPTGTGTKTAKGTATLGPLETKTIASITGAPAVIRRLALQVPESSADVLAQARLRITWDGRAQASVDAPVALFFGTGSLMRAPEQTQIVKALPMSVKCEKKQCEFATYFPMPFQKSARIELTEMHGAPLRGLRWEVRTMPSQEPRNTVGLFHATYRDFPRPDRGKDMTLLDTREVEGGGDWCGHVVGTTYLFTRTASLGTLEGDPRFWLDDSQTPQGQGTGSEEWGGGGDYWGGRVMTLPFVGKPVGKPPKEATNDLEKLHSAYRFLLADLLPFGRNARVTLEHGGDNTSNEHYETVAYWYGLDSACLALTDGLDVGNKTDEDRHGYRAEGASEPYTLQSRFEWGPDTLPVTGVKGAPMMEVFPPVSDDGRRTVKPVEMTLAVDKNNVGVMLRRRLDLAYPDQKARVLIQDEGQWKPAGTWYTAGGNTVVFADPNALPPAKRQGHPEVAPPATIVETSNRRLREDEFLLPRALTAGRDSVRVRIEPVVVDTPLYPGAPRVDRAWTELRYWAYSLVMPK